MSQQCYSNEGFSRQSEDRYECIDSTDEEHDRSHHWEADNETFVDDFDCYEDIQQSNALLAAPNAPAPTATKLSRSCSQYQATKPALRHNAFPYRSLNLKAQQRMRASPIGAAAVNSFREDAPPPLPPRQTKPPHLDPQVPSPLCRTPVKRVLSRTHSESRRSLSVPSRRLDPMTADILAPMIAAALNKNGSSCSLRRSRSTIALRQNSSAQIKRVNSINLVSSSESTSPPVYDTSSCAHYTYGHLTPRRNNIESVFEVSSTPSKSRVRRHKGAKQRQLFKDPHDELSQSSLLRQSHNSSLVHRGSPKVKVTSPGNNYGHRNTAVIAPLYRSQNGSKANFENLECEFDTPCCNNNQCRSPYRSPEKPSWGQLPTPSLALGSLYCAAFLLFASGFISCLLCFYQMSTRGRRYYLDFALFAGFVSILLGFLGFRFQYWKWFPNRNYISGYILSCLFSLLLTGCLVTLLYEPDLEPPMIDIAGGALCGVAILSASLTSFGLMTSFCCRYPPPDNRVAHAVQGFTV